MSGEIDPELKELSRRHNTQEQAKGTETGTSKRTETEERQQQSVGTRYISKLGKQESDYSGGNGRLKIH